MNAAADWKTTESGLIVPVRKTPSANTQVARLPFLVTASYQEIHGKVLPYRSIARCLATYSITDVAIVLSRVGLILEKNPPYALDTQRELVQKLFSPETQRALSNLEHPLPQLIVHERQLLTLFKLALRYCSSAPPEELSPMRLHQLSELLLAVDDMFVELAPDDHSVDSVLSIMLRQLAFNAHVNSYHLLCRCYRLFVEIPAEMALRGEALRVNWNLTFSRATGMSLLQFIALGVGMLISPTINPIQNIYEPNLYFANSSLSPTIVNRFLRKLARGRTGMVRAFRRIRVSSAVSSNYEFIVFRKYPLLLLPDKRYIPISLRLLKDRFSSSLYWDIHEQAKSEDQGGTFRSEFGSVFETYVLEMLHRLFPSGDGDSIRRLYLERDYKTGEFQVCDAIVIYHDSMILLDATIGRLRQVDTAIEGDLTALDAGIDRVVIEKARQFASTLQALKDGKIHLEGVDIDRIRNYYPVIVTLDPWPSTRLIWDRIEQRLMKKDLLQEREVRRCTIVDAEELEILEQVITHGQSWVDLLDRYLTDSRLSTESVKNFLISEELIDVPHSDFLQGVYARMMTEVTDLLVPGFSAHPDFIDRYGSRT